MVSVITVSQANDIVRIIGRERRLDFRSLDSQRLDTLGIKCYDPVERSSSRNLHLVHTLDTGKRSQYRVLRIFLYLPRRKTALQQISDSGHALPSSRIQRNGRICDIVRKAHIYVPDSGSHIETCRSHVSTLGKRDIDLSGPLARYRRSPRTSGQPGQHSFYLRSNLSLNQFRRCPAHGPADPDGRTRI